MRSLQRLDLLTKSLFVFLALALFIPAEAEDSPAVYVWDFTTRSGERSDVTRDLTEEFEQSLIQSNCCTILQRRYYARLFERGQAEQGIMHLGNILDSQIDNLKTLEASAVAFGEVYDDTKSGQVRVSVTFESFDGAILAKESALFPRFALPDPFRRQKEMDHLVAKLPFTPNTSKAGVSPAATNPSSEGLEPGLTLELWLLEESDVRRLPDTPSLGFTHDKGRNFHFGSPGRDKNFDSYKKKPLALRWSGHIEIQEAGQHVFSNEITIADIDRGNGYSYNVYSLLRINDEAVVENFVPRTKSGGDPIVKVSSVNLGPGYHKFELWLSVNWVRHAAYAGSYNLDPNAITLSIKKRAPSASAPKNLPPSALFHQK